MAAGRIDEACPKLEASLRLDSGIGTMLFVAECWDRQGRTASAWAQFREAADAAKKAGDPREKVARQRAGDIEPKLSRLTITVVAPQRPLTIERDGRELPQPVWATALPVDPGEHVVTAVAPGYAKWSGTVRVAANGASANVEVPSLQALPATSPAPATRTTEQPQPVTVTRTWQRVLGAGLAVVGVGGIAVGTGFGLSAIAKNDRADEHCPTIGCDEEGLRVGETADDHAFISTIAFAAGAALVVGGAILYFTASRTIDTRHALHSPAALTFTF